MNRNTIQIDTQSLADLGDEAGWPRPSPSHLSSPPFYLPHPLPLSYILYLSPTSFAPFHSLLPFPHFPFPSPLVQLGGWGAL